MKVESLKITYGETTDDVFVRKLKFRKRAAIFQHLKADAGDAANIFTGASIIAQAQFVVEMISQSVCDKDGKLLLTEDDVDDWDDTKRNAYSGAIITFQSPKMEDAAKNSSSTPTTTT